MSMKKQILGLALSLSALAVALPVGAQELIVNGDFEAGLGGWTVSDLAGSFVPGSFFIDTPGTTSPVSGFATAANPAGGGSYAVSDQGGAGTHALTQAFTLPALAVNETATLTFEMFVNDQNALGAIIDPIGLDHTGPANQHARVDLLTGAAAPFDTGAGVLANFYLGVDPGPTPNPYTTYRIDITALVAGGGTYQIRFAEVDNQFFFQQGVDNVSIIMTKPIPTMTPAGWVVLVLLLTGVAGLALRRRQQTA